MFPEKSEEEREDIRLEEDGEQEWREIFLQRDGAV